MGVGLITQTHISNNNKYCLPFLSGDGGYPLRPFLITPFRTPVGAAQQLFNKTHCTVRCRVEIAIGRLKNTFRCLLKERPLRYTPVNAARIIYACATLKNYLLQRGITGEEWDAEVDPEDNDDPIDGLDGDGSGTRDWLVNYFNHNNNIN